MGLSTHIGMLHFLIEGIDPVIQGLVSASWLTREEIEEGLTHFEGPLTEAGFFTSIQKIAKTHSKSANQKGACPKGQKMVFGVCREVGKPEDRPPKDFFAAAQRIATYGPDSVDKKPKPRKEREPKAGEDDAYMPPAWHRKKSEYAAQQADFHKGQAKKKWTGDPRSAAHHVLRSIEYEVRKKHHDQAAEISPEERQRARSANDPPRPKQ